MTALSIDATDREPVTGWEATQPDHRRPLRVELAFGEMTEAWQAADAAIDYWMDVRAGDPDSTLARMASTTKDRRIGEAQAAEIHYRKTYHRWENAQRDLYIFPACTCDAVCISDCPYCHTMKVLKELDTDESATA